MVREFKTAEELNNFFKNNKVNVFITTLKDSADNVIGYRITDENMSEYISNKMKEF